MKQISSHDGISSMSPAVSLQSRYPAKHVNPGCACRIVEAPNKAIKDILKNGGVPLLTIGTGDDDKLALRVRRSDGRAKYIVVQHTQFDGLASSKLGAITTCQLLRIAIRLGELQSKEGQSDLYFWLDALCEDQARASPTSLFRDAYASLIIDPSLQMVRCAKDVPDVRSHTSDIIAGFPRLALSKRLLLASAYGYFDGTGR